MARNKPKTILYRRKREQKTNYTKRLKLLLSQKLRLVVRFTNQKVIAQLVEFTTSGDKVLVGIDSTALKEFGWQYSYKNFPAAYLTGLLLGKKAIEKGHKEAILDTGLKLVLKKGKIYAFLKGSLDSGMDVRHSDEILPDENRIKGKHIETYAQYLKSGSVPEGISSQFEKIKQKIMG